MTPERDGPARSTGSSRWWDIQLSTPITIIIGVAMVGLIALGDSLTGPYLVFATFYLMPVVLTAWFARRLWALGIAFLAAVAGFASTALDPGALTPVVYELNAVLRFITYAVVALLVDTERSMMQTIREVSELDPLTKMSNRRRFFEQAELELARAARSGDPVAIVYIDVDDLKLRNDTYGHRAGDEMLMEFAELARDTFRATDLLARLGGDEFCMLLPGADLAEAEEAVERLEVALHGARVLPIRISAGIVAGTVDPDLDVETVVHGADGLMYEAKAAGKGQIRTRASLRSSR